MFVAVAMAIRLAVPLSLRGTMKKRRRNRSSPPFVGLKKELLLKQREWWDLSHGAKNLYLLLKCKYNGSNNGQIKLYYAEIQKLKIRSLKSPKDISQAFAELERKGWIERTTFGGLHRHRCEYRLTARFDTYFPE